MPTKLFHVDLSSLYEPTPKKCKKMSNVSEIGIVGNNDDQSRDACNKEEEPEKEE